MDPRRDERILTEDPNILVVGGDLKAISPEESFNARIVGAIERELGAVNDVLAVFLLRRFTKVCTVITVIPEDDEATKHAVYDAEARVEAEFPTVVFDFSVRLAQGRPSTDVVPSASRPVFYRGHG